MRHCSLVLKEGMVGGRGIKEISGQLGLQRNLRRLAEVMGRELKIRVHRGSESGHGRLNESRPDRTHVMYINAASVTQDVELCRRSWYTSDTSFV